MTHAQLVQKATNLLAEMDHPQRWLPEYDRALGSESDRELERFVELIESLQSGRLRFAA